MMRFLLVLILFLNVAHAADEPVVRFNFEENAADTSIVNYGSGADGVSTRNTSVFCNATGKIGKACDFYAGSSEDGITISSAVISDGAFTFAAWLKPDSVGGGGSGRIYDGGDNIATLSSTNNTINCFRDSSNAATSAANIWTAGEWVHIAIVGDAAGNVNFYKNGESWDDDTFSGAPNSDTDLVIGNRSAGGRYFDGLMDDILIFDEALTATEIQSIYNRATKNWTVPGQPVVLIKAEDNAASTTVTNDGSGADATSDRNTDTTYTASGKIEGGFDCYAGSTADNITLASDVIGDGADSVFLWAYAHGYGGANVGRFVENSKLRWNISPTGGMQLDLDITGGIDPIYPDALQNWPGFNEWHHVGFVKDSDSKVTFYLDGEVWGTPNQQADAATAGDGQHFCGNGGTSRYFDGVIDNIRIYDRQLSAEEIAWIFEIESPGYHNFRDGKYMLKDGVPTLFTGIYHINSTDATVAADIPTMKAAGFDFAFVYMDATSWGTVRAAWENDVELIPENNGITEAVMDNTYGPFEIALAYDDLDAGCGTTCDYSCADVQTRVAAIESTYSNSPLAYASAGLTGTDTSVFFDCDLDMLGYQAYPVGDGSYTNEAIDAKNYYWAGHMADYNGPFIANTQAFEWAGAGVDLNARQIADIWDYAELFYPAGFLPYTWDDGTWDIGSDAVVKSGTEDALTEAIRCEDHLLKRAMTEY